MPFATNTRRRSDRPNLLEANTIDDPSPGIPYAGLRTRRFKYIRYRSGEMELYDLNADPTELTSLHASAFHQALISDLKARLDALKKCTGTGPTPPSCEAAEGG
jgi:arylsulfatase A-like enzyme